jgi:hypothetical protein
MPAACGASAGLTAVANVHAGPNEHRDFVAGGIAHLKIDPIADDFGSTIGIQLEAAKER